MNFAEYIGQTLDEKYRIERELGRGGMGTVYLATHLGTERHVAVKIIAPQFMERVEFVERFRREARAAGRLRHPNVVNVTDFGFAETKNGRVAYLVMEYLDGCTLGEILDEEHQMPLAWTLDILEQVSSAVHAAHGQGIIHRDLKPDNIWLEPNQRGGYTVKVLDFGIAKLEGQMISDTAGDIHISYFPTSADSNRQTVADLRADTNLSESETIAQNALNKTLVSEKGTLIQPLDADSEKGTLIQPVNEISEDATAIFFNKTTVPDQTSDVGKIIGSGEFERRKIDTANKDKNAQSLTTKDLTHVGAVLGTPLFMSPEQCRGEKLTASSDIYSLGVIAYRMLSGKFPFEGDHTQVMQAHKDSPPPTFETKKVPRKVKRVVFSSLAKIPEQRPPTAEAFAAEMRSQSEGIGTLLRRSMVIYSEHLPKFLSLSVLFYSPAALFTILQVILGFLYLGDTVSKTTRIIFSVLLTLISTFFGVFCGYLLFGTTTWLVTQILAVPLRPVKLRPALLTTRRKWQTFAGTGMMTGALTVLGLVLCVIPGIVMSIFWSLVAPIVMMENVRGFEALKRSKALVKRSLGTTVAMIFIMFFVPLILSSLIAFVANAASKSLMFNGQEVPAVIKKTDSKTSDEKESADKNNEDLNVDFNGRTVKINGKDLSEDMGQRITATVREALTQILLLPITILVGSFSSIVVALLYLKTRQVGGEPMQDLLAQFEETEQPRTKWQERVRQRLLESGRTASKP